MKTVRTKRPSGFSLVELVIVIVIIGVIAAIAIPRISRGAAGADESALRGNLAVLRSSIDMYAAEHGGTFPGELLAGTAAPGGGLAQTEGALIGQLTMFSKADGIVKVTKDAPGGFKFGPYLRKGFPPAPVGPNRGKSDVEMVAGTPVYTVGGKGWVYSYGTGELIINTNADTNDAGDLYNTF